MMEFEKLRSYDQLRRFILLRLVDRGDLVAGEIPDGLEPLFNATVWCLWWELERLRQLVQDQEREIERLKS